MWAGAAYQRKHDVLRGEADGRPHGPAHSLLDELPVERAAKVDEDDGDQRGNAGREHGVDDPLGPRHYHGDAVTVAVLPGAGIALLVQAEPNMHLAWKIIFVFNVRNSLG